MNVIRRTTAAAGASLLGLIAAAAPATALSPTTPADAQRTVPAVMADAFRAMGDVMRAFVFTTDLATLEQAQQAARASLTDPQQAAEVAAAMRPVPVDRATQPRTGTVFSVEPLRVGAVSSAIAFYMADIGGNGEPGYGYQVMQWTWAYPDDETASAALTRHLEFLKSDRLDFGDLEAADSYQDMRVTSLVGGVDGGVNDGYLVQATWRETGEGAFYFREGNVVTKLQAQEFFDNKVTAPSRGAHALAAAVAKQQAAAHGAATVTPAVAELDTTPIDRQR